MLWLKKEVFRNFSWLTLNHKFERIVATLSPLFLREESMQMDISHHLFEDVSQLIESAKKRVAHYANSTLSYGIGELVNSYLRSRL